MTEEGFLKILERVENAGFILDNMGKMDSILAKVSTIENFVERFGTLEQLIERFESVEKQLYILKGQLTMDEAAKYLNISKGHLYRLTSTHEITYSKPNGKNIFFDREDLDEWKRRNRIPSHREVEQQAVVATIRNRMADSKKKGGKL